MPNYLNYMTVVHTKVCFPMNLFYTAPKNISEIVGLFDVSDKDGNILALSDNDDDDGEENYESNSPIEENVASANVTGVFSGNELRGNLLQ